MSGSGGSAFSRSHGGDRFYNPPAMRRHQQMLLQQRQLHTQLQRASKSDSAATSAMVDAGNRTDSDDSASALSKPTSVRLPSPPISPPPIVTNLDRFLESVTPLVTAHNLSEGNVRGRRTREAQVHPFYCLGDLWESFNEWSVYGVGVPLLLNGKDHVKQYYVPFLSGIQLYVDPSKPHSCVRWTGEESDAESSRETSSCGSSDREVDKRSKSNAEGLWNQHNLANMNTQRLNRLSLREKAVTISSSDDAETCNSSGQLLFEYLEQEQPHHRKPLVDKISVLASQFPELRKYRSCDLLPSSWISVAWYFLVHTNLIYACIMNVVFLAVASLCTFYIKRCAGIQYIEYPWVQHYGIWMLPFWPSITCQHIPEVSLSLSVFGSLFFPHPFSYLILLALDTNNFHYVDLSGNSVSSRKVHPSADASSRISLPVFGLASYKLKGSILTPCGPHECKQEKSLLQAAGDWLQQMQVVLPDYQFFHAHYSQWRR